MISTVMGPLRPSAVPVRCWALAGMSPALAPTVEGMAFRIASVMPTISTNTPQAIPMMSASFFCLSVILFILALL